jgi:hypothetical protein
MPKTTTKKSPSPVKAAIAKTPTPTQPTLQAKPKVKRPRHNWKNPEEQKAWKKDYNRRYYQNHKPVKATAVPTKVVAMPAAKKPEPTYLELLSRVEKDMSRLTKSLELVRKARAAVPPPMELKSTGKGRPARLYRVVSPSGEAQTLLGMTSVVKTIGISHSTVERAKRQASKAGWQLEVVKQAQARG